MNRRHVFVKHEVRDAVIEECAKIVADMRVSEAELFDAAHSGAVGEARSNALYDAYRAIRALSSQNRVEGER